MRITLGLATFVVALLMVAFAAPTASADIVSVAAHERKVAAKDARTLKVGHRNEQVERLAGPGLVFNREALVTNEGYAVVFGKGTAKLQEATITIGYHVGCAVALANLVVGLQATLQALGVNMNGAERSKITVVPDEEKKKQQKKPPPDHTLYPGIEIKPKITVELDVGSVADIQLATAPVRKGKAKAGIERTSIKVEGCIGPIAVRSYVALTTKSKIADETVVVYGDPVVI